jgi:CheY-like chemotaxis protein
MSAQKTRKKRELASPGRRSILVVDDEAGTADVLTSVLEDAGFDALSASNGREALAQLSTATPDVLLLDLMMPELDGAETLSAIKADSQLSKLLVVMMSGIPESMVKRRARGYHAFLRKPFSLDELLTTLNRLLKS